MISASLRFEGFDSQSWTNLVSLFSPGLTARLNRTPVTSDAPELDTREAAEQNVGSLVIIVDDQDQPLKAFHTTRGRVTDTNYSSPSQMPDLCERYGAHRVFVLREGVMEEITERLALRLERGDDYVTQWLTLMRILRELQDAKLIRIWPRPLENVPVPSPGTVRRALDVVLPDERCMLVTLWQGSSPWTALALRRRSGAIDTVVGPDLICQWAGPLGGDWRRDHRVIVDAVSRALAPVHVGVFSEVDTMRDLLQDATPGHWARSAALRDVIVYPTPPYAAVALGADALRGVTRTTRRFLGGIDALSAVSPITDLIRGRIAEIASVRDLLGFDPLEALAAMLRREPTESTEDESNAIDS
jgi:hypothetical protein